VDLIEIRGLRIAFERAGAGPPVLLLHGLLADSRAWLPQLADLSADFTVVAWDAPGCGQSSDPPESFRMADFAECVALLIDELGLESPAVVGLSFGGALALQVFDRRPTVPSSLALVSAYAGWAGSLPDDLVRDRRQSCLQESRQPPERFVRKWMPSLFTSRAPEELVDDVVHLMSTSFHPIGYRAMVHSLAESDLRHVLPTIDVPTLLIHGSEDQRCPATVSDELHRQIKHSELVTLQGVGHFSNLEAPKRFNTELRRFLESQTTSW